MSSRDSAFNEAFATARTLYRAGDLQAAFSLLERAHLLGQRQLGRHWAVHVWMLRIGWRRGDLGDEVGGGGPGGRPVRRSVGGRGDVQSLCNAR